MSDDQRQMLAIDNCDKDEIGENPEGKEPKSEDQGQTGNKKIETMEDICEKLDDLVLRSLELMEERMVVTLQLENQLRDGHIELAKARYICGKESVGMLQVPKEVPITTLFNLETTLDNPKVQSKAIPHFDISMKSPEECEKEIQNPVRWFGVLVPQSLKTAQKRFQECLYLSTRIANISAELDCIPEELQNMKKIKKELVNDSEG